MNDLRIYLDNCCFNRPYDDQSQFSVNLEAQAKLHIQAQIHNGEYELVTSDMLYYEIQQMPHESRKQAIEAYIEDNSSVHVGYERQDQLDAKAAEIMKSGVKYKDACHVASAILAGCEYFLTTDRRLLRFASPEIAVVNPVAFINQAERRDEDE